MDIKNTLNNWKAQIKFKLEKENFYNLIISDDNCLQIVNEDYISTFNNLITKKKYTLANLDDVTYLNKAMNDQITNNPNTPYLFSNRNKVIQKEILDKIIAKNNESINNDSYNICYLTFGMLNYTLEDKKYQAPLIFLPIRISYDQDSEFYHIESINSEVILNTPLIDKIKKVKKLDVSYPVNKDFSLGEFIYYISVKVKPLNWTVNNVTCISCFDFSPFYNLNCVIENEEKIEEHEIVKKIAYLNSEFFKLSYVKEATLNNKYLSLLDLDNEEYNLLRTISKKDNVLIRCSESANRYHFLSNIISNYMLNNQSLLVVYSSKKEKEELKKELKKGLIDQFSIDLDIDSISKEDELVSLVDYDKFTIPFNSLHPILIDEDVTQYYDLKNSFKNLANNLKTTRNPLKTSINKIINNYYALDNYPLINIQIKDAIKFDIDILRQYLGLVKDFANSIVNLDCDIKDHPFYGFSRNEMCKDNYTELKNSAIVLSTNLKDVKTILNFGKEKYHLPYANNLKELKALLNIFSFISEYRSLPLIWLNNEEILDTYIALKDIDEKLKINEQKRNDLISSYGNKINDIDPQLLNLAITSKKPKKHLKKIRKLYLKKNISFNEELYLLNSLCSLNEESTSLFNKKETFDSSYNIYLENHSFDEFKTIIDKINLYRKNLNFISDHNEFNIIQLMESTSIEESLHRQSLQIVFNSILKEVNILKEYFNQDIIDFDTLQFDEFYTKTSKMATSFASINKYLDFYLKLFKTNKIISGLGDELLANGKPYEFESIYLKRFYFDLLSAYFNNKDVFQNFTYENIKNLLNSFNNSDVKRKELISKIIYNNFNKNTRTTLQDIKNTEGTIIYNTIKNKDVINPLKNICNDVAQSIYNFKPCVMISYKEVSNLLTNNKYKFDGILILSTREMEIIDILPSLSKSKHVMISDNVAISGDIRTSLIRDDNMSKLIVASKNTFKEIDYKQSYFSVSSISKTNIYDLDFKAHLLKKLKAHGFEATMNQHANNGIIDIAVKAYNSHSTVAIMVDHLPYYSPEDASKSFEMQERFINESGYHLYRLFPAIYFKNEEEEFNKLVEFIIEKSKLIPEIGIKKSTKLLMDYLFPLYEDPRKVLYEINSTEPLNVKLMNFLKKTCPISLNEIKLIFKENIEIELKNLEKENSIIIEDDYIYIPNQKVRFRRVDRNKNYYRPLNTVSKKEIYDAIYEIVDYKVSLSKEVIIKMILLSLGYKKANEAKYQLIDNEINYLLSKKILFLEDGIIRRSI